ncbi:YEATS multi-domain protein [Pyrenophora tritici-repentis]|nr:YEATS multi-domain protein [Pyrenophora tritici-repentis]PZD25858.1 YEATS multi-domain protein [Pyrenophora tritici-repentis]
MTEPAPPPPEDIAHDDLCPICQLLLFTPVRTQCNHLLCASCMAQWADTSSTTRIEHSSLDVHLADFDPNYDPTYDLEANCPMCRTHTTAAPDAALAAHLEKEYPVTYAARRVEEAVERGGVVGQDGVEGVMILIGNTHKLVRHAGDANEHDWTFFVRMSRQDIIKEVRVELHPTFPRPRKILRNPPYEIEARGWGTFTIAATIVLKSPYCWLVGDTAQEGLDLTWLLDFDGSGKQGRVRAKVRRVEEAVEAEPGGRRLRLRQGRLNAMPHTSAQLTADDALFTNGFGWFKRHKRKNMCLS